MNAVAGRGLAAGVALAVGLAFAAAVVHLPAYGESRGGYETRRAVEAVRARHATNLDAFVNFDLRGFDTLGEEFIFLVAIAGFSLLLRERRGAVGETAREPAEARDPGDHDPAIRIAALAFMPIALVYGLYIIIHGQLTPGGGFQGGVVLATAALGAFFGLGYRGYCEVFPKSAVEAYETVGALGYIALGAAALVGGRAFLTNIVPVGHTGSLLSGGTIDALNIIVGIAISGGFIVLFSEFINETRAPQQHDPP